MEDLETSWAEVVITEVVATLAEVSSVCKPAERVSGFDHTNARTFYSDIYMSKGVARLKYRVHTKVNRLYLFFLTFKYW